MEFASKMMEFAFKMMNLASKMMEFAFKMMNFAKDGMYYREFPTIFDWVHNGEGLTTCTSQKQSIFYGKMMDFLWQNDGISTK